MSDWPKGASKPEPDDTVQVLMSGEMARRFEERCLGQHTRGHTHLAGPLHFGTDDLPTYIIGVGEAHQEEREEHVPALSRAAAIIESADHPYAAAVRLAMAGYLKDPELDALKEKGKLDG